MFVYTNAVASGHETRRTVHRVPRNHDVSCHFATPRDPEAQLQILSPRQIVNDFNGFSSKSPEATHLPPHVGRS